MVHFVEVLVHLLYDLLLLLYLKLSLIAKVHRVVCSKKAVVKCMLNVLLRLVLLVGRYNVPTTLLHYTLI